MPKSSLRFVQRVGSYHYFRKSGGKRVRLPGEPGSERYLRAYEKALAGKGELLKSIAFMAGSLGWTIDRYTASGEFASKAQGTRAAYLASLRTLRDAPIARGMLRDLNRQHVNAHCSEIEQRFGRSRGDHQALLISVLWDFADRHLAHCKLSDRSNPTRRRKRTYDAQPRLAWPQSVQRRFVDGASPELKLAFALLLYTGQRRGDVVRMRWSDFDGRFINITQQKTGESVHVRTHRDLLKTLLSTEHRGDFILTTKRGKPFDKTTLTKAIKRRLREIGGEKYTLHGLRKAAGVRLAEAGASVPMIMSILGHRSPGMALFYCREANKRQLSDDAMKLWERAA
ncbi:MAG TPA: tyrosine-type recombinase/integrase [Candidatus Cybelea sp.]|nr:tyrosine-type recombinase/integrase [Candidatus Cybelea sp.]